MEIKVVVEKEVNVLANWEGNAIIEETEGNRLFLYDSIALDAKSVDSQKIIVSNN